MNTVFSTTTIGRILLNQLLDHTEVRFNVCISKEPIFDLVKSHLLRMGVFIESDEGEDVIVTSDGRYPLVELAQHVQALIEEEYATIHRYNVIEVDFNKRTKR